MAPTMAPRRPRLPPRRARYVANPRCVFRGSFSRAAVVWGAVPVEHSSSDAVCLLFAARPCADFVSDFTGLPAPVDALVRRQHRRRRCPSRTPSGSSTALLKPFRLLALAECFRAAPHVHCPLLFVDLQGGPTAPPPGPPPGGSTGQCCFFAVVATAARLCRAVLHAFLSLSAWIAVRASYA